MFEGERTWKKNFGEYYTSHPGKIISASEDPNVYVAPPHPCSCYQPGKQSNMETKLWRSDIFSTRVRRALDPSASPSEFGKEFWSTNSSVFRFLQLAALSVGLSTYAAGRACSQEDRTIQPIQDAALGSVHTSCEKGPRFGSQPAKIVFHRH
eukprot:scaffold7443_cov82-Skeletonema_dohrnii-CCMP3373.AAC.2